MAAGAGQALIGAIKANGIVNWTAIGCSALLVADYLETLPDEIRYMWRANWSLVKVLFFLVRYYPFAHTAISAWHHGDTSLNGGDLCMKPFAIDAFSCIIVTWICDAISYLRVYAFSGRKRALLAFLVPWYIIIRVAEFYLLYRFVATVEYATLPPPIKVGCVSIKGDSFLLSWVFIAVLASLGSITVIMVYVAYQRRRNQQGPQGVGGLFNLFFRDGIMYFVCLSSLAIANIIFDHAAPQNGTQYAMVQIQIHANAILTGRMLMDIRAFARRDVDIALEDSADIRHAQRPRYLSNPRAGTTSRSNPTEIRFAPYDERTVPKMFVRVHMETTSVPS